MVYEGVRDVRRSVMLMKDPADGDSDSDVGSAASGASTNKTTDTLNPKDRDAFK
jgi:hypothetical protein